MSGKARRKAAADNAEPVLRESEGQVTTITLNRPQAGNRLTNDMAATVQQMIDSATGRVIVLRGAGEDFCLGRELPPEAHDMLTALEARDIHTEPILSLCAAFERAPLPIVGVVQGKALGGACALAAMCDVTIAADNAEFALPELNHGIPPCLAMAALARRVPRKAVVHLVYSTKPIDAATALSIGLVSRLVPLAELEAAASSFVGSLAQLSPPAVQAVKQFMRSAPDLDSQSAAALAANLLANVVSSKR
jgi:enoyl-CoA hydratase/carnithine racemase